MSISIDKVINGLRGEIGKLKDDLAEAREREAKLRQWWPTWDAAFGPESEETSNSIYRVTDDQWGITHYDEGEGIYYPTRDAAINAAAGIEEPRT